MNLKPFKLTKEQIEYIVREESPWSKSNEEKTLIDREPRKQLIIKKGKDRIRNKIETY